VPLHWSNSRIEADGAVGADIKFDQIGGFRSDRVIAGKLAPGSFGVLQQYRHYPEGSEGAN
jgi:hypothetical protein